MAKVVVVYHSGYGHTQRMAQSVAQGADAELLAIDADGNLPEGGWETLDAADAIIFGSPTYMGSVSWQFKKFADASSKAWFAQKWKDKVAAGFTNSGAKSGDKVNTLVSLAIFAAQHHMHWVSLGLGAGWNSAAGSEDDLNRLGFWLGAGAQTDVDANSDQVHPSDVQTCRHLGWRVAVVTRQLNVGRTATPAVSFPAVSSAPTR